MVVPMLKVYRSNRAEKLVEVLCSVLEEAPLPPMEKEWLSVPSLGMGVWLQRALASRIGVFAGVAFPFPREVLDTVCFGEDHENRFREETVRLCVFELLPTLVDTAPFREIERYLEGDDDGMKRMGLAGRIAHAFSEYTLFRPEMVLRWEQGDSTEWQAHLFRAVVSRLGPSHIARGAVDYLRNDMPLLRPRPPFRRIFFFTHPGFPPLYMSVLRALSETTDIHLMLLSPSAQWWGDIRTRKPAGGGFGDLVDDEEMQAFENPFLTTLGKVGRDFQWILEETVPYVEHPVDLYEDPAAGDRTVLRTIQSDMLHLRFGPRSTPASAPDDSIRIVSCHGPEREVEVLKDQLLDVFDRRRGALCPEDVLVMAPDMTAFGPFVEAVFGTGEHRIPFNLTDRGGGAVEVVQAFLAVMALHGSRLTVSDVFDLLTFPSVRARFGLDEPTVQEAEAWIREAEVRWGVDEAYREALGQPGFRENTWRFGLDRLLLGIALDPETVPLYMGVAPTRCLSGDDAQVLGNIASFAETLFSVLAAFDGDHSFSEWISLLHTVRIRLIHRDATSEPGHQRIVRMLNALTESAEHARQTSPVPFSIIRKQVAEAAAADTEHKAWRPSGVTFSDFNTMRGIPFKVIALIGMNEGVFPRRRTAPHFDLIAKRPKIGDRQVTHEDRYQFLETLLSVRDTLLLSYKGQDPKDNTPKPPSVLVSELAAALSRCFDTGGVSPATAHPLQPFGSDYFHGDGDPRLFSYSRIDLVGAETRQRSGIVADPFFCAPLEAAAPEPVVHLGDLIRFFSQPSAALLQHRLGLRFYREEDAADPREPMQKGQREDRTILETAVRRCVDGEAPETLRPYFRARGLLPLGRAGDVRFERLIGEVLPIVAAVKSVRDGAPLAPIEVDLSVRANGGTVRIVGALEHVWPDAQVDYGYAYLSGTRLIRLWIRHLAMIALARDDLPERSVSIGRRRTGGADRIAFTEPPADPLLLLGDLVTLRHIGAARPLHLIPRLSYDYAEALEKNHDPQTAAARVRAEWQQGFEASDMAVKTAFRGQDPLGPDTLGGALTHSLGFENLAERVFFPLLDAVEKGAL